MFTPADNFTGRSLNDFGLKELVTVSKVSDPIGVSVSTKWIFSGVGNWNDPAYDAKGIPGSATFKLEVVGGVSDGMGPSIYTKNIIKPSGVNMKKYCLPCTGAHNNTYQSAGVAVLYYLEPQKVSFSGILFGEGTAITQGTGVFLGFADHPKNHFGTIGGGNITDGCKVVKEDHAGAKLNIQNSIATGTLIWDIPAQYMLSPTGTRHQIRIVRHEQEFFLNGNVTISKDNIPVTKAINDPTATYGCNNPLHLL